MKYEITRGGRAARGIPFAQCSRAYPVQSLNRMRPLVYLFTRTFLNGIRRSLSSPKRALGLIFFAGYYYFLIIRSVIPTGTLTSPTPALNRFEMPDQGVVGAVIFGGFAFASVFMMSGLLAFRGGFRPPDVDVLFPTPVSPKVVLIFRILRDYLFTLVAPLLLGLLGWRGTSVGLNAFIHNYPVHSMNVLRGVWLAWMLMSFGWVSLSYGASLFVGRSDLKSDRNYKVISYSLFSLICLASAYIFYRLHEDLSWNTALALSQSPFLEVVFLPATLARDVVMEALNGNIVRLWFALAGLISIIGLGLALALTQVSWLYDQGAAKGFSAQSSRKFRRSGDHYGLAAERARQGKSGRQWLSKRLARFTAVGPWGLIWKEQLLQLRGPLAGAVLTLIVILLTYGGLVYVMLSNSSAGSFRYIALYAPCITAYVLASINGFTGFVEMLKKVDVLKPLPFSPGKIIFFEVLSKVPIPGAMLAIGTVELMIVCPTAFFSSLSGLFLGIGLLLVITTAILLAVVLFPDYEDPTQRGLSGMVMLLAIVICSSPGLALFLLLSEVLHLPDLLSSLPASALLISISIGVAYLSGFIYADYNPNE